MGIADVAKKIVIETSWPWFKKYIWPTIQVQMAELASYYVEKTKKEIKHWANDKVSKIEQEAQQKAQEAQSKADTAVNDAEAEKFMAVAQVWREVAEQLKGDSEEIKQKLEAIEAEVKFESATMAIDMDIKVDTTTEKPILQIGEKVQELPPLTKLFFRRTDEAISCESQHHNRKKISTGPSASPCGEVEEGKSLAAKH